MSESMFWVGVGSGKDKEEGGREVDGRANERVFIDCTRMSLDLADCHPLIVRLLLACVNN